MPPMSTVRTFIDALRTGKTRTMLAFDAIFTPPYEGAPWLDNIHQAGAFDDALPPWAVTALAQKGLSAREIAHINIWPNDLKEQVRQVVQQAVDVARKVDFNWGLTEDPEPRVEPDTTGDPFRVKFLTPRSAVTQAGPDDIDVGIYPPPSVP